MELWKSMSIFPKKGNTWSLCIQKRFKTCSKLAALLNSIRRARCRIEKVNRLRSNHVKGLANTTKMLWSPGKRALLTFKGSLRRWNLFSGALSYRMTGSTFSSAWANTWTATVKEENSSKASSMAFSMWRSMLMQRIATAIKRMRGGKRNIRKK